ncbi:hypothetical protein LCGC14_2746020, partial [marine sediment metagenome]
MVTINKIGRWGVFEATPPAKLEAALYNRLSYEKEGANFMPNRSWGIVRFYNKRLKRFPWGLISRVEKILEQWLSQTQQEYQINFYDKLIYKEQKFSSGLRPYQVEAIKQLILNAGGIISLPCGSGKTKVMVEFLKKMEFEKSLVIVPTLFLKLQWQQQIKGSKIDIMNFQSIKDFKFLENYKALVIDECHITPANTIYK